MLRAPITTGPATPKSPAPKPPEMPRARTLTESANSRRMAPYWLSGVEFAVDEQATRDAVARGILSEEEVMDGFTVPQFAGGVEDMDGTEQEQVCVLVGYLTWKDHEEYAATFGEDINDTVAMLLQAEGALAELQVKEIERYQTIQKMDEERRGMEQEYADKLASGKASTDDLDSLTDSINTHTMAMMSLRSQDLAEAMGINILPDGTVILPSYGPVRRRQKTMDLMGFILSRHGRIVGVTDEWFNIKRSTKRGLVSPTVFKKCFETEPISQDRILELIMPDRFLMPLKVEETTDGKTTFSQIDAKTPFWDILMLAQLYSLEEQESEMKKEQVVSEAELQKASEASTNPL